MSRWYQRIIIASLFLIHANISPVQLSYTRIYDRDGSTIRAKILVVLIAGTYVANQLLSMQGKQVSK